MFSESFKSPFSPPFFCPPSVPPPLLIPVSAPVSTPVSVSFSFFYLIISGSTTIKLPINFRQGKRICVPSIFLEKCNS